MKTAYVVTEAFALYGSEPDAFEVVGVFESEKLAVAYLRTKGRYADSKELTNTLRECYIVRADGKKETFRLKEMPMNVGE